jgi:RHS repeat-associated protein
MQHISAKRPRCSGVLHLQCFAYQGNPFGEQQPTSTTGYVLNLRYSGQYYDAESNTNYNINRDYDPTIGRYNDSSNLLHRPVETATQSGPFSNSFPTPDLPASGIYVNTYR